VTVRSINKTVLGENLFVVATLFDLTKAKDYILLSKVSNYILQYNILSNYGLWNTK